MAQSHLDLVIALNNRYKVFMPGASDEQRLELTKMVAATLNARSADGLRWGLKEKPGQSGVYSPDVVCTESPYEAVDISNGSAGNAPCWSPVTSGWPNGRFTYVQPHDYLAEPSTPPAPGGSGTATEPPPAAEDLLGDLAEAFTVLLDAVRGIRADLAALKTSVEKAAADVKDGVKLKLR